MLNKILATIFFLLLLFNSPLYSIEEVSNRITSLGIGLTGIIPDTFTDLQRNPAYLVQEPENISIFTFNPSTGYRAGIFGNPTPFLSGTRGGAIAAFEVVERSFTSNSLSNIFPLDFFSSSDASLSTSHNHPPGDLTKRGRNFLIGSGMDNPKLFRGVITYAVPLGRTASMGINFLYGKNGIGTTDEDQSLSTSLYEYESSSRINYYRYTDSSHDDEVLKSLRIGFFKKIGERCSTDFEITASRSTASTFVQRTNTEGSLEIFADSTVSNISTSGYDNRSDPFEKEVIDATLFLHRKGAEGGTSLRLSFFSGDAFETEVTSSVHTENDTISRQYRRETSSRGGWTGGLAGFGGYYRLNSRPFTLFWGGFYGFMRAWQVTTFTNEEGIQIEKTDVMKNRDNWDNHLWQINIATEYVISSYVTLRLGSRATAIYIKDHKKEDIFLEPEFEAIDTSLRWIYQDIVPDVDLTGGFSLTLTDWLTMDIYTPSFSSINSWSLESLIKF